MKKHLIVPITLLTLALATGAQAQDAPLQVDARVRVNPNRPVGAIFRRPIEEGQPARLRGVVMNQAGGETALIDLRFSYRIPPGTIALDEIIDRIVISVEDSAGGEFSTVSIDPNDINLNPNRVPLDYSATLYIPDGARQNGYFVRVRVFGNYE